MNSHGCRPCFTLLCALFLLLLSGSGIAAPVVKIQDEYFTTDIAHYLDAYIDSSSQKTIEDIQQHELSRQFAPLTMEKALFGFVEGTVWLRMSVRNDNSFADRYTLLFKPISIERLHVYDSSRLAEPLYNFADSRAHSPLELSPGLLISLGRLEPGEQKTFYLEVQSAYPLNIEGKLYSVLSLGRQMPAENGFNTLIFGVLLSVALLSIACVLYSHERVFAWGAGHALSAIGYLRSAWGYPALLIFDELHYHGRSVYVYGVLTALTTLAVTFRVLKGTQTLKSFQPALWVIVSILILILLAQFFVNAQLSFYLFFAASSIGLLTSLAAVMPAYAAGHKNYLLLLLLSNAVQVLLITVNTLSLASDLSTLLLGEQMLGAVTALVALVNLIAMCLFFNDHREQRIAQELSEEFHQDIVDNQASLLSKLTHEIRTPMAGVLGMTELLRGSRLSDSQSEFADNIDRSAQELLHIIDDVTAFAHIQNGTLPIQNQSFGILEMLDELMLAFGPEAERKNIELVFFLEPGQPGYVEGDAVRTRHILSNLISNCIARQRDGEVFVKAAVEGEQLFVSVEDTGPGLSQAELDELFVDESRLTIVPQQGGIGLPLSKHIAEALGGDLHVESLLKEGTKYHLQLPIKISRRPPVTLLNIERLQNLQILLVDDNGTYCDVIERQVAHWGGQVESCLSGSEALALLRARQNIEEPFDVLLVDYSMPGMDGVQLLERIQVDENIADENLIIIMLSGLNSTPDMSELQQLGVRRLLQKPLSTKALQEILLEELQGQKDEQSASREQPVSSDTLATIRVLLAEDNEISSRVIERMLHRIGVSATLVSNGEEALSSIQREHFHLVLMDCEMPVMDGFEATELVRRWEEESGRQRTIVVALTAHLLEQLQDRIHAAGMDDQVSKPLRIHELQDLLRRWVPEYRSLQVL